MPVLERLHVQQGEFTVLRINYLKVNSVCLLLRGEKKTTSDMNVYGTSKIYLIMASKALNERLKGTGVEVFAAHPGDKHPNAIHHFTTAEQQQSMEFSQWRFAFYCVWLKSARATC